MNGVNDESDGEQHVDEMEEQEEENADAMRAQGIIAGKRRPTPRPSTEACTRTLLFRS
jgi:hypothetical protein